MTSPDPPPAGTQAAAPLSWNDEFAQLSAAATAGPLEIAELERLAVAAHMLGRTDDATRAWEAAHHAAVRAGDPARAAGHAFHLVMGFGQRGEVAQAGGWFARASRLVEEAGDCVEAGYLLVPVALRALDGGNPAEALAAFEQAGVIAERFGNRELSALSRLGQGQCLIGIGETERGVALIDEAMVAVTAGELSPLNMGIVYCASIEAFQAIFDLHRAQEWTAALTRWCDSQPDIVPFRGRCLVYRSELLQFHGQWREATSEVARARDWLSRPPPEPAIGEAHYQQAELHRLRGDHAAADAAYREGGQWGRRPDPGLALLRLAQGDRTAAAAMIRRALDEADGFSRPRLLEPCVEILLALGEIDAARSAAEELARFAAATRATLLQAVAARATGTVRLAEGKPRDALGSLRRSWTLWQDLEAPYEAARTRVHVGLACRALGDHDTAAIELEAARRVFEELGAATALAEVQRLLGGDGESRPGGLTEREIEVLRLVAGGKTNREIAAELVISERTVDRHVSNIFTKLDVSTRAAATAFAYEHDLLR